MRGRCTAVYAERTPRANQDVFRRANERLLAAVRDVVDDARAIPFLCECLDPECRSTVQLSIERFRDLREMDNRYAIFTGHPIMNGERPIEVEGDVTIVQKPDPSFVRAAPG
jgi:hypothetical protein